MTKCLKKNFHLLTKFLFENVNAYVELGYQGIKKDYFSAQHIHISNKKPRK